MTQLPPTTTWHNLNTPKLRSAVPALINALRRLKADVVFSTFTHINLLLLVAKPLLGTTRIVLREASMPSANLPLMPMPRMFAAAVARLYPTADRLIASSQRMRTELCAMGIKPDKVSVLHNPVNEAAFREAAFPLQRLPGPGRRFVGSGHLTVEKGMTGCCRSLPIASGYTLHAFW